MNTIKPGFAVDQCGDRWIVFEKNGDTWAMGLSSKYLPMIRKVIGDQVETNGDEPNFFRSLVANG